jgi:hypothetical protein
MPFACAVSSPDTVTIICNACHNPGWASCSSGGEGQAPGDYYTGAVECQDASGSCNSGSKTCSNAPVTATVQTHCDFTGINQAFNVNLCCQIDI